MRTSARTTDDFEKLHDGLKTSADRLCRDLRACLEATLPALDGARACGRALGLKRQLGWRAYTVATSSDLPSVLEALPRRAGWGLILASLSKARCPAPLLNGLSEAVEAVLVPLESGRISRSMLRALAGGRLDSPEESVALLRARRATREGAEQMHGVRCKAQLGAYVIGAPDRDGWIDIVTLMEYADLRRIRPGPPIAVKAMNRMWHPDWKESRTSTPLGTDARLAGLVTELSTPEVWERHLRVRERSGRSIILFEAGGKVSSEPVRLVFAERIDRGGTVGRAEDLVDLLLGVHVPSELCVFDAWLHRSIKRLSDPMAALQGSLNPMGSFADLIDVAPLPCEAQAAEIVDPSLPRGLRSMSRTHARALEQAFSTLGGAPGDFVGFRVIVPDPPIGSRVHLRWRM
jgi:hypothetical protein